MTQLYSKKKPRRLPKLPSIDEISTTSQIHQVDVKDFARRCYKIFERLRPSLIENHYNWFLIVEPDSGDYFLAEDEMAAYRKARSKYPENQFFFFRINETGTCGRI
jgi:hypothetical protein